MATARHPSTAGLHGLTVMTTREIGKRLGISRERVRAIENSALRKIRIEVERQLAVERKTLGEWVDGDE